ncbi:hypothetical protein [Acidihalobacter ferrooxydans]|uniref:hypothetical protein n=1 Tax=Acidihalobacter ferrooxydans TaxID=1765967 RepID=UPI0012EB0623|nr:hypothetical protein [Acidihalobacter ferrooxydans]
MTRHCAAQGHTTNTLPRFAIVSAFLRILAQEIPAQEILAQEIPAQHMGDA